MNDPVTWLDVLVLLGAYLIAAGLHKLVVSLLAARERLRDIQAGDEAAPDRQDGGTADTSRAVCNDPAASSPLAEYDRERLDRWRH